MSNELEQIQRWLQAVIMHPDGVVEGMASSLAQEEIPLQEGELESVVTRSMALPALDRLSIYSNAYYARLLECLREEFAVLAHFLGEELFDAFAFGYLQQHSSQSYTLGRLGARFPAYLETTRPSEDQAELPGDWPEFLIDLAKLEWTTSEVFDGPGLERETALAPEQLLAIPPDRWADARLVPAPSLRLLKLKFPVHQYYGAVRRNEPAGVPPPGETFLAVSRRNYIVYHHEMTLTEYDLLARLAAGTPVGEAIAGATPADSDIEQLGKDLQRWFHDWSARGYFQSVAMD